MIEYMLKTYKEHKGENPPTGGAWGLLIEIAVVLEVFSDFDSELTQLCLVLNVAFPPFGGHELFTPGEELGITSYGDSSVPVIGDGGYVRHNKYAKNTSEKTPGHGGDGYLIAAGMFKHCSK